MGRRGAGRPARRRRATRALLVAGLASVIAGTTFVGGLLAAPIDFAVPPPPKSVLLFAADGRTQIGAIPPTKRRELVAAADIPQVMRDAIIAAEDERFLTHRGVDPVATVRALANDIAGGRLQGGSTLTQQYVKNVYVDDDRTLLRKVREAALAVRLEQRLSKEQILTDYLNVLYLGNGVYGVEAAARYYFGVSVRDLDLDELRGRREPSLALARAAMLAGFAPAPSRWNPVADKAAARARQLYTLNRMVRLGMQTPRQISAAYGRGVVPLRETVPQQPSAAPEFTDLVTARLRDQPARDEDVLFRGGLRVRTTLDADLQAAASRALQEVLPGADDPQGAVAAVDIRTGDVRAMTTLRRVPARGDQQGELGYARNGTNLATNAYNPIGSTIKPFTLAVALEQGHQLTERRDAPACGVVPRRGPDYRYCNASGESGPSRRLSLRRALASSVNTVYVPLAIEVDRNKIKKLMLDAGVRTDAKTPITTAPPSFGLGSTAEVSPLSLAGAYAALVNSGVRVPPRYVLDVRRGETGTLVEQAGAPQRGRVLPAAVADQVTEAMGDVVTRGTATAAQQDFPVYGKTGTTNDYTDAWFVGCVREPENVCLVTWMGHEFNEPMKDVRGVPAVGGGTLPAKVFARTFEILRDIQAGRAAGLRASDAR